MDKIMTNNSNLRENVRIQFTYNGHDYKSPKYLKINMFQFIITRTLIVSNLILLKIYFISYEFFL